MDWLRYYTNTLESRKIQSLPPILFKAWVNLLCVSRIFDGIIPVEESAFRLRVTEEQARSWLSELRSRELIDVTDSGEYFPHDWDEHQKVSDDAAGRKRKQREKQLRDTSRDTVGTSPVLDQIRSDQIRAEQIRAEPQAANSLARSNGNGQKPTSAVEPHGWCGWPDSCEEWARALYRAHPKKKNRVLSEQEAVRTWASMRDPPTEADEITRVHRLWCRTTAWTEKQGQYCPQLAEWLADKGYLSEPPEVIDAVDMLMDREAKRL